MRDEVWSTYKCVAADLEGPLRVGGLCDGRCGAAHGAGEGLQIRHAGRLADVEERRRRAH